MLEQMQNSPSVVRSLNLHRTLDVIRAQKSASKADLIRSTGLSRPTINYVVEDLIEAGLIIPSTKKSRGGGSFLEFNKAAGILLGISLEVERTVILMANLAGEIEGRLVQTTNTASSTSELLSRTHLGIQRLLSDNGFTSQDIRFAVFSLPGILDPFTNRINLIPTLPQLKGLEPSDLLRFDVPVIVENNFRAATRAEVWRGVARGRESVIYLGINDGIGAAIQINGQLFSGAHGTAGEIGYLSIPSHPDEVPSRLTEDKTLEDVAGISAFLKQAKWHAAKNPDSLITKTLNTHGTISLIDIAKAATHQDPLARRLVANQAHYLSIAALSLVLTVDPEMLIIGGQVVDMGETLIGLIRNIIEERSPNLRTAIVRDALGNEGAAIGAIGLALEANDEEINKLLHGG